MNADTLAFRKTYGLLIGQHLITDILNPKAEEIDLPAIEQRIKRVHRFSNNPEALTVWQHSQFVSHLAAAADATFEVRQWCLYHDWHEGITGDIPGPLKNLIRTHTDVLDVIERRLDLAICGKLGIAFPDHDTRAAVHHFDKMAETLEWHTVLGKPLAPWCYKVSQSDLLAHGKTALFYKTMQDHD